MGKSESSVDFKKTYPVKFLQNVLIPMEDGVRLSANIHLPDSGGMFPAILEYLPYRKDDYTSPRDSIYHDLASKGFAGVRIDIRGTGGSWGQANDEYSVAERNDAYRSVEWIAKQSWCNGRVGVWGSSYGGFTAIQVAMMNPPSLKAILPMYATDDRYTDDCHYSGGALRAFYDAGFYGSFMVAMNALPPYPEISGKKWKEIWKEHLENDTPWQLEWLKHQTKGDYWDDALGRKYDRIKCPTFIVGGWRDGYPNPPLRLFSHLKVPKKLIIGPWAHVRPNEGIPGPGIDFHHEMLRWFAHWLVGVDSGIMSEPPIAIYLQKYDPPIGNRQITSGYWRHENEWPLKRAREINLYLHEHGQLSRRKPSYRDDSSDSFSYIPTVGTSAGLWSGGPIVCLPGDQRKDDARSVVYTSELIEQELEIFGFPVALLHASSSARIAFFVVRLSDVAPDGTSALICKGILNATRRESFERPLPMEPNKIYSLKIPLDATCWLVEKGHRIRISISGSDWPNVWPSPLRSVNQIYHGKTLASRITLPSPSIRGEEGLETPRFRPPAASAPTSGEKSSWRVTRDNYGNTVIVTTVRVTNSLLHGGKEEYHTEERMEAAASEIDPAECYVKGVSEKKIVKKGRETYSVTSTSLLKSNAKRFSLSVALDVRLNKREYFSREWTESFPRELL